VSIYLKAWMRLKFDPEVKISWGTASHALPAFAIQADAGTVGNPRRNLYLEVLQSRLNLSLVIYLVPLQGYCPGGTVMPVLQANGDFGLVVLAAHQPCGMPPGRSGSTSHAATEERFEKIAKAATEIECFCLRTIAELEMHILPARRRLEVLSCLPVRS
jgi:hypothetical protein